MYSPFPTLTTPRLILRQIDFTDSQELFVLRSDRRVMAYIDRPLAKTVEDAGKLIQIIKDSEKEKTAVMWAVTLKGDPKLIGTVGYWKIMMEHFRAEIGYLLHPDFQGKGIMQEAIEEVIRFGFDTMGLHSIEANVNPENTASIRLLERNNFVREGYFRENYFFEGRFLDTAIYSLLARW
jgi:[ribosomal protein S5]-alanine N-acetyltransferase